jgi:hypothetical protein
MAAENKAATKVTGLRELLSLTFAWKYRLTSNRIKPSGSPTMPTGGIQTLLEESRSDAILIYDSCCSADTAMIESTLNGITELMAACWFQTTAPGVGPTLFFYTCLDTLFESRPFGMRMFPCHFPFLSLDLSSCCFRLSYGVSMWVSIPEHRLSIR